MPAKSAATVLLGAMTVVVLFAWLAVVPPRAQESAAAAVPASDNYESWPLLRPTFPSTGGNGFTIKGYDPVITGERCVTTFMAVEAGDNPKVYANVAEFDAVPAAGGTLCHNGRWRAFEGGASGTTPFRFFLKDGVFRGAP